MTSTRARRALLRALGLSAYLLLVACDPEPKEDGEIVVFAASSLQNPLEELARDFEAQDPSSRVRLTFGGSQVLRLQVEQGAAVDIFASADEHHMGALENAGLMAETRILAESDLVVITPRDDHSVRRFEDLVKVRRIVLGREEVPVGRYAREVLARASSSFGRQFAAQVEAHVVSMEGNVRLVQAKVELGEADAAFVYRTEALRSGRVRIVEIPEQLNVRAQYEIGLRKGASARSRRFVEYALSKTGAGAFLRAGFRVGGADAR